MQITKQENVVASEAGNSPAMIYGNLRELVTDAQAQRWFSILPDVSISSVRVILGSAQGGDGALDSFLGKATLTE